MDEQHKISTLVSCQYDPTEMRRKMAVRKEEGKKQVLSSRVRIGCLVLLFAMIRYDTVRTYILFVMNRKQFYDNNSNYITYTATRTAQTLLAHC